MVVICQKHEQGADPENGQHGDILVIAGVVSADGEHGGAQEPSGGADKEKDRGLHVAESDDIGKGVLGKTGDQKEDEGDKGSPVLHEVIVLLDDLGVDDLLHKGQAEPAGKEEGEPRTDGKADCGIKRPQDGTVEVAADEAVDLTRDRRHDDLEDLEADKDQNGEGAERSHEVNQPLPADEEDIEVVMEEKDNTSEDQQEQDRNFKDGMLIHGSATD